MVGQQAMGRGPQLTESKLCLEFVQDFFNHLIARQQILAVSTPNVCPELVQYREFIVGRVLWLDKLWTNIGFSCPIFVQELVHGHALDRTLTRIWQTLYLSANQSRPKNGERRPKVELEFEGGFGSPEVLIYVCDLQLAPTCQDQSPSNFQGLMRGGGPLSPAMLELGWIMIHHSWLFAVI